MKNENCNPKLVITTLSLDIYPATDQPIAPNPCEKIFNGYTFKFVKRIPNNMSTMLDHFRCFWDIIFID